jgi:exopolysaccharide biosynthesis polyprenyl glycosylphosphotransferase
MSQDRQGRASTLLREGSPFGPVHTHRRRDRRQRLRVIEGTQAPAREGLQRSEAVEEAFDTASRQRLARRRQSAAARTARATTDLGAFVAAVAVAGELSALPAAGVAVFGLLWITLLGSFGLHARSVPAVEETRRLLTASCLATLAGTAVAPPVSRTAYLAMAGLLFGFEVVTRMGWRAVLRRLQRAGQLMRRTLIIGDNEEAVALATRLQDRELGFRALGFVATSGRDEGPLALTVAHVEDLPGAIAAHDVSCLFVASSAVDGEDLKAVTRAARQADVEVRLSTNLAHVRGTRLAYDGVGDAVTVVLASARLSPLKAILKRTVDIAVAGLALVVTAPVCLVISAAVLVSSGRPVLFRQERTTKDGRTFTLLKFRSMPVSPSREPSGTEDGSLFTKVKDPDAFTPVGRVLRTWSLDELPQLWNVLRGDMSLVGPRPLPREHVVAHTDVAGDRHEVRAGLTGWWQINGRSDLSDDEALRSDLFYIENWSLSLDLLIIARTFRAVLSRKGAY